MTRLSFSALMTYLECGEKYANRYIYGWSPAKIKSSFLFGKAVDVGLETLLHSRDLNLALKTFRDHWRIQEINGQKQFLYYSKNISYTKNDLDKDLVRGYKKILDPQKLSWLSLLEKGQIMLKAYYDHLLPKISEVLETQKEVRLYNSDGDYIIGFLDLKAKIDNKVIIVDNKTTSVKYDKDSASVSEQLTTYNYIENLTSKVDGVAFAVVSKNIQKNKKKICKQCGHDGSKTGHRTCNNVLQNKRCNGEYEITISPEADAYFVFGEISKEQEEKVLEMYDKANHGISNKIFTKNKTSCIGKYGRCEYFEKCHYGNTKGLIKIEK